MVKLLKSYTILLFISIALFSSCKKDPVYSEFNGVRAGVSNDEFHNYSFPDSYFIDKANIGCGVYRGSEALDLNIDGNSDLVIIERHFVSSEFNHLDCMPPGGAPLPLTYSRIYNSDTSSFEILSFQSEGSNPFADTLNFNTTINSDELWSREAYIIKFEEFKSSNPWLIITEDKYIGIRSYIDIDSTYKYGWIKIGIENDQVVLKEMAFQK